MAMAMGIKKAMMETMLPDSSWAIDPLSKGEFTWAAPVEKISLEEFKRMHTEEPAPKQICNQLPAWIRDALVSASKFPNQRMRLVAIDAVVDDAKKRHPYLFRVGV